MSPLTNFMSDIDEALGTKQCRKYVLNDFSVVEKAVIQIIESVGWTIGSCEPGENNELKIKDTLPVQINPSEFNYEYHINTQSVLNGLRKNDKNKQNVKNLIAFGRDNDRGGSISIPLIFDIYDEYNARSMNGSMTKDFSLAYKNSTALTTLIDRARDGFYYARFTWGDIVKFGLLTGISVTYTAFSPWGQPLKANATVNMVEQRPKGGDPRHLGGIGNSSVSDLKQTGKKILTGIQNIFR